MLDLDHVDLGGLAGALEDHSYDHSWWLDPASGQVVPWSEDLDEPHPEEQGFLPIDALPSSVAYADMEDFIDRVPDARAVDLLARAISGRGAFRRFKDTLFEFPTLREAWFRFHDVRMERRAIEWLQDEGLVADEVAARALAARPDPPIAGEHRAAPLDVARAVAEDLRALYGGRLQEVVLFGSHARGDAHAEADLDLLVVLHDPASPWEELRRMDEVLWRHTRDSGITVSVLPVSAERFRRPDRPALVAARAEGRRVG